jgi:hypothetical protein
MFSLLHGSTNRTPCPYLPFMKQLMRTNNPVSMAIATSLLQGEGIDCFEIDVNMSVLEGSIGILPRRLMVREEDYDAALRVITDNGMSPDG